MPEERALAKRRRRVLVVDDHQDTAHSLAKVLHHMGHLAEVALNGRVALKITETFRPEIILLDMLLPDFDGADLSRLLRLKAAPSRLKIVAITGHAAEEAHRRATHAGCDAFLLKPLDFGMLEMLLHG
jgi:DNA-binding response OmpR family regulator